MKHDHRRPQGNTAAPQPQLGTTVISFADTWKSVLQHTKGNPPLHKQLMLAGPHMVALLKEQPDSELTANAVASFASFATTPAVSGLDGTPIGDVLTAAMALVK